MLSPNFDDGTLTILQAFFYDWLDRTAAKKGKPLPEKIGSMQFFLHGFTGVLSLQCIPSLP